MKRRTIIIIIAIVLCMALFLYYTFSKPTLPHIIWSYWHDRSIPKEVQAILEHRKRKLNKYEHITVYEDTLRTYIDAPFPPNFDKLMHQHKADWVRLQLLKRYGGCWMDAGILVNDTSAIDRLFEEASAKQAELSAFYLESRTVNHNPSTYIENWFLLAPSNSKLIDRWLQEFTHAITIGFDMYKKDHEHTIPEYDRFLKTYLTQHVCLQVILQDSNTYKILLYKAEDTMFKLHVEGNWELESMQKIVQKDKARIQSIPYIKLRGGDRPLAADLLP